MQQVPESQRVQWLASWVDLMSDTEREERAAHFTGTVSSAHAPWAQAELVLQDNPHLDAEVKRWWSLLTRQAQTNAHQEWLRKMPEGERQHQPAEGIKARAP